MLSALMFLVTDVGFGQQTSDEKEIQVVAANSLPRPLLLGVLPVNTAVAEEYTTCSSTDLQSASTLTFAQRTCIYRSRLLSKSFPIRAAAFSAMAEWRSSRRENQNMEDFTHRFGTYYARRTAQGTGEFLAGYFNHEDPRYHPSLEHGVWRRSRAALLSVLVAKDPDGHGRIALAPVAGAFGSGMAGMACSRIDNSMADGFRRTGTAYGLYFGTAIFREFRPELMGLANRFTHRR